MKTPRKQRHQKVKGKDYCYLDCKRCKSDFVEGYSKFLKDVITRPLKKEEND